MFETLTTKNHPYYVRTMIKKWNNTKRKYDRIFEKPNWKKVCELTKNDFVGVPIPLIEENPLNLDNETCYLLGRYVADGYYLNSKRKDRPNNLKYTNICIGNNKRKDFEKHIASYKYSIDDNYKGCAKYRFGVNLTDLIIKLDLGKGAINKKISQEILNLPIGLAKSFLDGYMSGDGCYTNNSFKSTSISKELVMGIQLLVAKVYKTSSNVVLRKRHSKYIIEGRTVNQHNTYSINFQKEIKKQNNSFVDLENNIIWYPVKYIEKTKMIDTVYNLEVENDNSYTANNFIVHNCQDFSVAGKQAGGDLGAGTRSSLMWNTVQIVTATKPKYVIWENVKNLLSKKHRHNFDSYLSVMESLGYNNYYQILNAKDYGIPQNRERVYTVSIRKDIDKGNFKFPEKGILKLRLKDMLEDEVDEKYYLSDEKVLKITNSNFMQEKKRIQDKEYCDTLLARDWKDPKCVQVGELDIKGIDQIKRVYSDEGLSPTLTTMGGGNTEPKIMVEGNYMPSGHDASRIVNSEGLALTVKENHGTVTAILDKNIRVRKLTPKECFRLMGFSDEDFEKAQAAPTSNTQLYKQAGNSIVVKVLEKIFTNLF